MIATKHGKERVIAPILEQHLGVHCFIANELDTDAFGTFTGEIPRTLDPIATLHNKCRWAMEVTGCDLAVASEGSFGPHPSLFIAQADDEFLLLIDAKNHFEIMVRELSLDTNFNGRKIHSWEELRDFAETCQFPSHGLILRPSKTDAQPIYKGIVDFDALKYAYNGLKKESKSVYVETDMRALYNPTRMGVIEKAAQKLVEKIKSTCPKCQTPGYGVVEARNGLPCKQCGAPTNSILSVLYRCLTCGHETESRYPKGKIEEDPMYCDYCNP